LTPREQWRFFCNVPLLPFEFWWRCGDKIVLQATSGHGEAAHAYRRETIQVNSCPVPFFTAYRRRENLTIVDDLGDIPIMRGAPVDIGR